ncbi:DUF4012 domain-containing protein [Leifsonia sp. YIM 134122]|uniref:DUF4012 domain-containing protein n=1 Tax=Leifsonia stereocauli TaxID=3134136 RepID=A0ABU9W401_9MICO
MSEDVPAVEPATATRRRGRLVWLIVGVVLVAVVGAVVWVGVRGWLAKGELEAAAATAEKLQADIVAGDTAAAGDGADKLVGHTHQAAALTGDPVWALAEIVPVVGPNLSAVRVLSTQLDAAASGAIRPLTGLAQSVFAESFRPVDGRIDVEPLVAARPAAHSARAVLTDAAAAVDAIDDDGLIGPVAAAKTSLATALGQAAGLSATLDDALVIAPVMLGADGPRNYLVLFQNNAELRTAGGIPGAFALVHAEDGLLQLVKQASTADFSANDGPALPAPAAMAAVFGDGMSSHIQDVTMTPDFTVSASLASAMWERRFGGTVDGVIAVDPVALSYLLGATGPVTLADGSKLTKENAVKSLLVDVYTRFPEGAAQDAFFAESAAAAFTAITGGAADPKALVSALTRAGEENRVSLWSSDESVQSVLAGTTLAGLDAAQKELGPEAYGVYLNDATGAKMDPYLDVAMAVGAVPRDDGRSDVTVTVTLTSTAAADAATSYPGVVAGTGFYGVAPGLIATNVTVFAPAGAFDAGVERDGDRVEYAPAVVDDRAVSSLGVTLAPGEKTELAFHYTSAEKGQSEPTLLHTPLMKNITVGSL